jgi:1-aminocyclopropane-1-carboxylate deaminase
MKRTDCFVLQRAFTTTPRNDAILKRMLSYTPTIIQEIKSSLLEKAEVNVFVKREDLNHPLVSGNKWWKLKYNLEEAKSQGKGTLLTFGGAFSNHIYATAAAAKELGFKSIGIIRGEEISNLSKTLLFAQEQGMRFHFVSREAYRLKNEQTFLEQLHKQLGDFYMIPEGGTNDFAIKGVEEFAKMLKNESEFDYLCCACGTGGTLAGIINAMPEKRVIGFSSLKGGFLGEEVRRLLGKEVASEEVRKLVRSENTNWQMEDSYHFGGYAKHPTELLEFIGEFEKTHAIPLEHVYTGKLFFGLFDLIQKGYFPKGSKVLALHTGGLQGKLT